MCFKYLLLLIFQEFNLLETLRSDLKCTSAFGGNIQISLKAKAVPFPTRFKSHTLEAGDRQVQITN